MRILNNQIGDDLSEVDVTCSGKKAHVILRIAETYGLLPTMIRAKGLSELLREVFVTQFKLKDVEVF
jgi:hypothetical protein